MPEIAQWNTPVVASEQSEIERLTREVAALRDEMQRLRAEVPSSDEGSGRRVTDEQSAPVQRRGRGRRPPGPGKPGETSGLLSRRRLFGVLGGAAAVGTGLAVAGSTLTADPAAASGDLVIDSSNTGAGTTDLSSTTTSTAFTVEATGSNGSGVTGTGGAGAGIGVTGIGGASGTGVYGQTGNQPVAPSGTGGTFASNQGDGVRSFALGTSGSGVTATGAAYGAALTGALAPLYLAPATSGTGPPTSGTHQAGEFYVDSTNAVFYCAVGGTGSAATWFAQSPLVPVSPPDRVYDSRAGDGPLAGGGQRSIFVLPAGLSAVLCNLTSASPTGTGFLAIFEAGTPWSGTSNINFNPGQDISNNATTNVSSTGQVTVLCGGAGSTQFIIDVFGYYP